MKKIILCIILLCIVLLSGCFQSRKYPKYEVEKQDNGQYILTTPDGVSYVTQENNIWFPVKVLNGFDYGEAIGKCDLGYVFDTKSEICIFTDNLRGSLQDVFFLEDTVLPELKIENINSAVLVWTGREDVQKSNDQHMAEKFIELYNNTETHEVKDIHRMERLWELVIECKQFRGLFFSKPIYTDGTDFYMFISFQYDSKGYHDGAIFSKCTSVIRYLNKVIADNLSNDLTTHYTENQELRTSIDTATEVYISYLDVSRKETIIPIDKELQDKIVDAISNPSATLKINDYEEADDYYFTTDIRVCIPVKDDSPVNYEIMINSEGNKILRNYNEEDSPVASQLCDEIIDIVKQNTDWECIDLTEIKDIEKAKLYYKGEQIAELTDVDKLHSIEDLIYNVRCIGYTPKTLGYWAELVLVCKHKTYNIPLDSDGDLMQIGSSFHYDYGTGVDGTEPRNNLSVLLELFSLEGFDK